jgi:hypothetical protein
MYNQISNLIQTRADRSLDVRPVGYPAPPLMQLFGGMATMVQICLIALLFINDKVLPEAMRQNKMMAFFAIFMVGNMIASTLTKTSAFEIYLGRKLVWSSLANERMPNLRDLMDGFQSAGVTINAPHG